MPEVSILDLTDDDLVSRRIIRMRDVVPGIFWLFTGSAHAILLTAIVVSWINHDTHESMMACAALFGLAALQVTLVKILFILYRAQLELRILATQLPSEAASMVVRHMSPPGLNPK